MNKSGALRLLKRCAMPRCYASSDAAASSFRFLAMTVPRGKPRPLLMFTRDFKRAVSKSKVKFNQIQSQIMTNVVLLATLPRSANSCRRQAAVYRGSSPPSIATSASLSAFSHEPPRTNATHYRISVSSGPAAGKYLVFGTGNIIRAGKHTHADAVAKTARLILELRNGGVLSPRVYPAVMSCPNTVVTGKFKDPVDQNLLEADWRVNSSKRFPGRSVSIKNSKIVPELYASDGRFIMPGVASPDQLLEASLVIDDVASKAARTDDPSP